MILLICSLPYRLTPSYMFVILFYANLNAFLGEGPLWYGSQVRTPCDSYWWTNLLYINNFHPFSLTKEVGHRYCLFVCFFFYGFFTLFGFCQFMCMFLWTQIEKATFLSDHFLLLREIENVLSVFM